jgi:hypothetical protein
MSGPANSPRATSCSIILEPGSQRPLAEISRLLSRFLGLHPTDAAGRVRYGGNILVRETSPQLAESLVEGLAEIGVTARSIDSRILLRLPPGIRARSLEILPDAICAGLQGGDELVILRESYRGVHLHALPGTTPSDLSSGESPPALEVESSLSPGAHKLREALRAAGEPRLALTLHCEPAVGPVRLFREDLDFASLGEKKRPHSLDNFLLLLEELHSFEPGAWQADRIRLFLERMDPADILYFKPEEGQNFDRWMQLWIQLQEDETE